MEQAYKQNVFAKIWVMGIIFSLLIILVTPIIVYLISALNDLQYYFFGGAQFLVATANAFSVSEFLKSWVHSFPGVFTAGWIFFVYYVRTRNAKHFVFQNLGDALKKHLVQMEFLGVVVLWVLWEMGNVAGFRVEQYLYVLDSNSDLRISLPIIFGFPLVLFAQFLVYLQGTSSLKKI